MNRLIAFLLPVVVACLLGASGAQAQAKIVNINAKVSGCTSSYGACNGAADHLPAGSKFRLISPVTLTLKPGTYRISYAGAEGRYKGWRINRESHWVWNFGIAVNIGGGKGQLLYAAVGWGIYDSLAELTASKSKVVAGAGGPNNKMPVVVRSGGPRAYVDKLTLTATTKLSFFVLDYDVSDNAGGVSLKIEQLSEQP